MADAIDVTQQNLGELTKMFAPDVPAEIAGAVFSEQPSLNTGMNGITLGGTLTAETRAKAAFDSARIPGARFDVNNPAHVAIATLRRMNEDYAKGTGDGIGFSKQWLGWSPDTVNGQANPITTTKSLIPAVTEARVNPAFNDFVGGFNSARVKQKNQQQTAQLDDVNALLGIYSDSPNKIQDGANIISSGRGTADLAKAWQLNVDSVVADIGAVAKIQSAAKLQVGIDSQTKADQTKAFLQTMGMDFSSEQASKTAFIANQAINSAYKAAQIQADWQYDMKNRPFIALMDGLSGGLISKNKGEEVKTLTDQSAKLSSDLHAIQQSAVAYASMGASTVSGLSSAAVQMAADLELAKGKETISKYKVEQDKKLFDAMNSLEKQAFIADRAKSSADISLMRLAAAKDGSAAAIALKMAQEELTRAKLAAETTKADPTSAQSRKAQADADAAELKVKKAEQEITKGDAVAASIGISGTEFRERAKDKNSVESRLMTSNMDAPPSFGLVKMQLAKGTANSDVANKFNLAYGPGGYAQAAVVASTQAESIDQAKLKSSGDKLEAIHGNIVNWAASKQNVIVNNGTAKDLRDNPYAANYSAIVSKVSTTVLAGQLPSVLAFNQTQLAKQLELQIGSTTTSVPDAAVISLAINLAQGSDKYLAIAPAEADRQLGLYFEAAAEINNAAKGFNKIGLPAQDSYRIPVQQRTGIARFASTAIPEVRPVTSLFGADTLDTTRGPFAYANTSNPTQLAAAGYSMVDMLNGPERMNFVFKELIAAKLKAGN